ncbi:MAG: SDR family oxidoreductase, partial [Firmicutes bacterium]|nr:SDR family oxidoreductase [Bacillota bacterium]
KGSYAVTRGFLPKMIERKSGVLLYTSSIWGVVGGACEAAYSASKGALISMTKALAKELGPSGIRVNCIAPGLIKTKMIDIFDEETIADLVDNTPLERIGLPEDVANAAVFLASEKASFITGQTLVVDGGIAL